MRGEGCECEGWRCESDLQMVTVVVLGLSSTCVGGGVELTNTTAKNSESSECTISGTVVMFTHADDEELLKERVASRETKSAPSAIDNIKLS